MRIMRKKAMSQRVLWKNIFKAVFLLSLKNKIIGYPSIIVADIKADVMNNRRKLTMPMTGLEVFSGPNHPSALIMKKATKLTKITSPAAWEKAIILGLIFIFLIKLFTYF